MLTTFGCLWFVATCVSDTVSSSWIDAATYATPAPAALELEATAALLPEVLVGQVEAQDWSLYPNNPEDKTGTNPLNFQRTLHVFNDYQNLPSSRYWNALGAEYIDVFHGGRMDWRAELPLVLSDRDDGDSDFGIGDLNLRYDWIPMMDAKNGALLGTGLGIPIATHDGLGTEKWTLAPIAQFVFFLKDDYLFAPFYQQTFSFMGEGSAPDINQGVLDFYFALKSKDQQSWAIIEPQFVFDYERDNSSTLIEVELGRILGTMGGGTSSAYIRPGLGIGSDREYDWSIEIGFRVIGI